MKFALVGDLAITRLPVFQPVGRGGLKLPKSLWTSALVKPILMALVVLFWMK